MRRGGLRIWKYKWAFVAVIMGSVWYNFHAEVSYSQVSSEGHSNDGDVVSIDANETQHPLRILWGIRASNKDDGDMELKRRDTIRRSYLGKNKTSVMQGGLPLVQFCSFPDLMQDVSRSVMKDCQAVYSFIIESEGNLRKYDPNRENDVISMNVTLPVDSSTERRNTHSLGTLLAWYESITRRVNEHNSYSVKFDWIIVVDTETLIYTPSFLRWLQSQSSFPLDNIRTPLVMGETPAATNSCNNLPRQNEKKACQKLTGWMMLLSSELANTLISTSTKTNDCDYTNSPDGIKGVISNCFPNVHTIDLPRQHRRDEPNKYIDMWSKLVDWHTWQYQNNLSVSYVTAKFGRDRKFAHQVAWKETALLSQGWDLESVHAYDEFPAYILDDPRWNLHLEFLTNMSKPPKGGGFWSWKSSLLLHHITRPNSKNGDFVIYADVDLRDHIRWTPALLKVMVEQGQSLAFYQVDYQDRFYDKRDVYHHYCPNKNQSEDTSLQYAGGWVVARKTPGVIQFLKDWEEGMSNYHFVNDEPSVLPNIPGFQYHLNDQSILSLLLKCRYSDKFPTIFHGADTLKDWNVHMFAF